jgi:CPA1 family monovalent cation:H+ antiporter
MGFMANALIFLLLGIKLGEIDFIVYWKWMAVAAFVAIFVARPISIFLSFFISNLFRTKQEKISFPYQMISVWGGLRGALSAAVVLMIPEDFAYANQLQAMTVGVIGGTFLFNALSITWLLRKLRLVDYTISEKIQKCEAQILVDESVRHHLGRMLDRKYINQSIYDFLENLYSSDENKAVCHLKKLQHKLSGQSDREIEKILTYHALGIEKKSYERLFEHHEISEKRFLVLQESVMRQLDRLDRDELPEERKSPEKIAPQIPREIPSFAHLRFRLIRKIARYLHTKKRNTIILERLQHYRARRIASWKVILDMEKLSTYQGLFEESRILQKIIARYRKWNLNAEVKMQNLEETFPKVVQNTRIKMAEHSCLQLAKKLENEFLEKGLISEKVFQDLNKNLRQQFKKNLMRGV